MSNSDDLEQLENDLLAIENLTQDGESVALRMRQRLNTQAAEIERLNEALREMVGHCRPHRDEWMNQEAFDAYKDVYERARAALGGQP